MNEKTEKIWGNFTVIRNINDAVTHLPPKSFGYFHAGTLLEIGKSGTYSAIEAHKSENIIAELEKYEK
jgi:NADH dehydrogenase FAD-containing subunit